jgi:hypothetical protein
LETSTRQTTVPKVSVLPGDYQDRGPLSLEELETARDQIIQRMIDSIPRLSPGDLPSILKVLEEHLTEKRAKAGPEGTAKKEEFSRAKALELLRGRRPAKTE